MVAGKNGGTDKATLADSAFDDTLITAADAVQFLYGLNGGLGSLKVSGFGSVTASATTGHDVANLGGTVAGNTLTGSFDGSTASGTLTGKNTAKKAFSVAANKFDEIRATGVSGGKDTAKLTDLAMGNLFYLEGSLARLTDVNAKAGIWADGYGKVTATLKKTDTVQKGTPIKYKYTITQK